MLLDGKIALVTGATRGTGAEIAKRMVDEGATVVVTGKRCDEGRDVAEKLAPNAWFAELDVTDEPRWTAVVDEVAARHGRIDVLVNNAAVLHMATIEHTSLETFRNLLDVNVAGAFLGIRTVAPVMRAAGGGSIINVASIDAIQGMNGVSAYAASKWAMRGLTKVAALEYGRNNIRVNTLCPAGGNPQMLEPWFPQFAGYMDDINTYIGARAMPREATVTEIANVVVFLASDLSRMVTGVDVPIDGGHSAGDYVKGFNTLR